MVSTRTSQDQSVPTNEYWNTSRNMTISSSPRISRTTRSIGQRSLHPQQTEQTSWDRSRHAIQGTTYSPSPGSNIQRPNFSQTSSTPLSLNTILTISSYLQERRTGLINDLGTIDRNLSYWLDQLELVRRSGHDPWVDTSISTQSSTWTSGTQQQSMPSSMTVSGNTFRARRVGLEHNENSTAPTSIDTNELLYGENLASFFATATPTTDFDQLQSILGLEETPLR